MTIAEQLNSLVSYDKVQASTANAGLKSPAGPPGAISDVNTALVADSRFTVKADSFLRRAATHPCVQNRRALPLSDYSDDTLNFIFQMAAWAIGWPEFGIDCDRRLIRRSEYGLYTPYGWQVDHIIPVTAGGQDFIWNLRPRHWLGNAAAGGFLGNLSR